MKKIKRTHGTPKSLGVASSVYGVELEYTGLDYRDSAFALTRAGFKAGPDGEPWQTKCDSSVTACDEYGEYGSELATPKLRIGRPSFDMLKRAAETLSENGAHVDQSCGLHVHHNASLTAPQVESLVGLYHAFQDVVSSLLPMSRRQNEYAGPVTAQLPPLAAKVATDMRKCEGWDTPWWPRYTAVNLNAISAHGSIEFRQHSGTLDPEKIENWVLLTKLFVEAARFEHDWRRHFDTDRSFENMMTVLEAPDSVATFYERRRAQLNPNGYDPSYPEPDYMDDESYGDDSGGEGHWCNECRDYHYD